MKTTKKVKPGKEKGSDKQFQEALETLSKDAKELRKQHKIYIDSIVDLCVNAKEGIFISALGTKNEQALRFNYSKSSLKMADKFLKKYAIKIKC